MKNVREQARGETAFGLTIDRFAPKARTVQTRPDLSHNNYYV